MNESFTIQSAIWSLKILKVLGFSSNTIVDGKSVTKPLDVLFFVGSIVTGISLIFLSIKLQDELATSKSKMIDFGNFLANVASLVIAITSMSLAFIFRHQIWNIVLELYEIERKFAEFGIKVDYQSEIKAMTVILFLMMSLILPLSYLVYLIDGTILRALLYLYSGVFFLLSVSSVVGLVFGVGVRVKSINKVLKYLADPSEIVIVNTIGKRNIETIRIMFEVYGNLVVISDAINLCYGVPVLLAFGLLYFYSLFVNYVAFKNFKNDGYLDNITTTGLIYSSFLQIFMNAVVYVCILTETEVKKLIIWSNLIIKRSKNDQEIAALMSFNSLVSRNMLKFSCGFFDFDWTLIYSVRQ